MFEEAKQALEKSIDTPAPDAPVQESAPPIEAPVEAIELAKLKKFTMDGEEVSYDDLKKERLRQRDYTRKTQELAEDRRKFETESKYDLNVAKDLKVLWAEPWRADEFRKLYPTQYHEYADEVERKYKSAPGLWSKSQAADRPAESSTEQTDYKKLIEETISQRLKPIEEREERQKEQVHLAELDAMETKLMQKYKYANKFEVYGSAEYLSNQGKALNEKNWDDLFKESHDRTLNLIKQAKAEEFNQQKLANEKLKDVQGGGGIPGEAPVVPKGIKEATRMFLNTSR